jgi:iron complex outermembrane recepter protein
MSQPTQNVILGAGIALALCMRPAESAPSPAAQELDTVTVTAQRRVEVAQDVPISLTVLSGDALRDFGIASTIDLASVTPGMTIGQNSGAGDFPFISLRGVTLRDFADTNESPSAVYINDFYKANLTGLDGQIFDMDRVEVLRGPQGTLYGRNATGGLIHYVTKAPTSELDGYASVTGGSYGQIGAEAAVGGPLIGGLTGRISAFYNKYDGWNENFFGANDDGNALDVLAFRGQLALAVGESSYSLFVQHSQNDNSAGNMFTHFSVRQDPRTGLAVPTPNLPGFAGYVPPPGQGSRTTNSERDIFLETEQTTAIGRGTWRIGSLELVSITGYEKSSKDATFDSDATPSIRGTAVYPRGTQWSQEFRLSGEAGDFHWVTGLYYFDYLVDGFQQRCRPTTCTQQRNPVVYRLDTESWAAFGNVDFPLTETLSATLGLRYTDDSKEYKLDNQDFGVVFSPATVGDLAKQDVGRMSYTARLNWRPAENTLFYGGVARGFKAGTFNVGYTPIPPAAIPVGPEELTSYELGAKFGRAGGRATFSGAVFVYDYQDSQAFQFDGQTLASTAFNRDAVIHGLEAETALQLTDGFDVRMIATYLPEAKLKDVELPGLNGRGLPPIDTRMPLTPDWSLGAIARYVVALPGGSSLAIQGGVNAVTGQYFDAFNSPAHQEGGYTTYNARITWTPAGGRWQAAVFAENLSDKVFRTYSFDLAFLNFATSVYGRPRWVGGTVSYSW